MYIAIVLLAALIGGLINWYRWDNDPTQYRVPGDERRVFASGALYGMILGGLVTGAVRFGLTATLYAGSMGLVGGLGWTALLLAFGPRTSEGVMGIIRLIFGAILGIVAGVAVCGLLPKAVATSAAIGPIAVVSGAGFNWLVYRAQSYLDNSRQRAMRDQQARLDNEYQERVARDRKDQ